MKLKYLFSAELLPNWLVLGFFIFFLCNYFFRSPIINTYITPTQSDTAFGGIFNEMKINDSLYQYQYKHLQEKAHGLKERNQFVNENFFGSGYSLGDFGVYSSTRPDSNSTDLSIQLRKTIAQIDTLVLKRNQENDSKLAQKINNQIDSTIENLDKWYNDFNIIANEKNNALKYFFTIGNYHFMDLDTKFYIENGNNFIAYVKWDTTKINNNEPTKYGHYARKKSLVRFSEKDNKVVFSISKSTFNILNFLLVTFAFILLVLYLTLTFWLPYKILVNISRGKAFIQENIDYLQFMIKINCILLSLGLVGPYIIQFCLRNKIPQELILDSFSTKIGNYLITIIIIVILFFIKKAFQKGYQLQEDNALTI